MSIVLAQIKKDIQSQRNSLIVWGICVGIIIIFRFLFPYLNFAVVGHEKKLLEFLPAAGLPGWLMILGPFAMVALIAGSALFLLVPLLVIGTVHQDSLVGSTAFWMTRPIPRGKLLAAKALLILALLLSLLVISGTKAHDSLGHMWLTEFAWIAAFASIASITSEMRQFLWYGLALIFGKAIFSGILSSLWIRLVGDGSAINEALAQQNFGALQTPHLNATDYVHLFYFIGFSIVFIHQYLTLERRRSLAILIMVIAVGCLLSDPLYMTQLF